uniref:Uncharacterized protein n=1 Tax=viral metagenome TaxID=1070528 RepID=A0A6C0FAT3_9ZZZZ|tara:strand:+ start:53996 stop:54454 length:459 start_codon:yes stop_codon:yes gene_type:complete
MVLDKILEYKASDNIKLALGVISILLWYMFIYELVFLTGTGRQGFISPNILFIFSFFLIFCFFHNMKHVFSKKKLYIITAGLLSFTIGTRIKSYFYLSLICMLLFAISLVYADKNGNSFGYVKNSPQFTAINSNINESRYEPLKYPVKRNHF